jgi:hypothetical protein
MPNFHIQWSGKEVPDPVIFASHSEVYETAGFMAKPNETFTIEQFDGSCRTCIPPAGRPTRE